MTKNTLNNLTALWLFPTIVLFTVAVVLLAGSLGHHQFGYEADIPPQTQPR